MKKKSLLGRIWESLTITGWVVVAVVAFLILLIAATLKGHAAEWKWEQFGAAPYAATREKAMETRGNVFRLMDLPAPVAEQFMQATEKLGNKVQISNGNAFNMMLSKGNVVHKDVVVAWKKQPSERGMKFIADAETWQVKSEGKIYTIFLPEVCFNWSLTVMSEPPTASTAVSTTVTTTTATTILPKAPTLTQYALQVNFMSDRPDGFWRGRYDAAKAKREENLRQYTNKKGMVPYDEVFTRAPFGEMLAERKDRPLDGKFLVRFLKKEPALDIQSSDSAKERIRKYNEYLQRFQYPLDENVLTGQWVSTGNRGWVIVPIAFPLDQFEAILIQPEQIGSVIEPMIVIHRPEFATQSNPVHIWEVSAK